MHLYREEATLQHSTLGVYVSVPFCRAKCSFCNFASGVSSANAIEDYVKRLCAEIAAAREKEVQGALEFPQQIDTLYFGGGTPSLLEPAQLRRIFAALRDSFAIAENAEITLEAAPGQIADAVLYEAQRLGVNRISLGVQSFVDRECAAVGRLHTKRDCVEEIVRLQAAGVHNVGVDLIAGLPYQTAESWQHSLDVATDIGLAHLSVYMLEVDEDSRLGREVMGGGERFHAPGVPADESSADFYEVACEWLPRHGFSQYEISNFAARQYRSKHNIKYWKQAPYIGFGLDAHSMLLRDGGAVRFANSDDLAAYLEGIPGRTSIDVRGCDAFEEAIFLGLRMNEGVEVSQLKLRFPPEFVAQVVTSVEEMIRAGMMMETDGRWQLTLRGRLVSNDVFTHLLMTVAA